MFVDERAMGEPYQPEKPYRLPLRFYVGILAPIPVALFSFAIGLGYAKAGKMEDATTWTSVGDMSLAFAIAVCVVAILHTYKSQSKQRGPPF